MPAPASSINLFDLGLVWPDGSVAIEHLTAAFGSRANGSGRRQRLRQVDPAPADRRAAERRPAATSARSARSATCRRRSPSTRGATVADLLGISPIVRAIRAVEDGDPSPSTLRRDRQSDWDIEARTEQALDTIGLAGDGSRPTGGRLSGGETMLVAIAGLQLTRAPIRCWTNRPTISTEARATPHRLVDAWPGTLVVVSHDVALLERMDAIAELLRRRAHQFGGPYSGYVEQLGTEQEAARRGPAGRRAGVKIEKRQRIEAETKLARRRGPRGLPSARSEYRRSSPTVDAAAAQASAGRLRIEAGEELGPERNRRRDGRPTRVRPTPGSGWTYRIPRLPPGAGWPSSSVPTTGPSCPGPGTGRSGRSERDREDPAAGGAGRRAG